MLLGAQGWCSGDHSTLTLMWPGFDSQTRRPMYCGLSFLAVLVSALKGFSPGDNKLGNTIIIIDF